MRNTLLFFLTCYYSFTAFSQTSENIPVGCLDVGLAATFFQPPSVVVPPIPKLEIDYSEFQIQSIKGAKIITSSGTLIEVPVNAFLDAKGNAVKGEVDLIYREFNNPIDIFLSGIPMTVSEGGEELPFQSAGMFELLAFKNEQEVFPNPNALIEVELNSNQRDTDYRVYDLNEQTGSWTESGGQNAVRSNAWSNINWTAPPRSPVCKTSMTRFKVLNSKSLSYAHGVKKPQFKLNVLADKWQTKIENNNYLTKHFQELGLAKIKTWIYDGEISRKELSVLFKRINLINEQYRWPTNRDGVSLTKEEIEQELVLDIWIEPNFELDNYIMHLIRKDDTLHIPVYPHFYTTSPFVEQKRQQKFYEKYKENYLLRQQEWAALEARHKRAMATYNTARMNYERWALANGIDPTVPVPVPNYSSNKALEFVGRRVKIDEFGLKNIDKLLKIRGDQIDVEILTDEPMLASCHGIYLLDETNNAVVFNVGNHLRFVKNAKNSLVIKSLDGRFAFISSKRFKAALKNREKGVIQLTANFMHPDEVAKDEIMGGLASVN